ncbi:protein sprouty homolog 2 isoform X2 [Marmota monax]|uniref:protein sprouty homolog 2 isoform X2 n=1 Tax=Marmota monax TaxID=9995 RepID=UPI001EB05C41|nr:protein sprouty homolog 2 isoform X2 [Marmota monax]
MPPAARSAGGRWSVSECSPAEPMSWDRMRYILWDNNCSVPPRIHMTPFTAAAAAAELPASSGKARAQANGEPPRLGPKPSSSSSSSSPSSSSATTAPASALLPRLHNAQSARPRAARGSASGGEGPAERAAPRPPRPPGPAPGSAPPRRLRSDADGAARLGDLALDSLSSDVF